MKLDNYGKITFDKLWLLLERKHLNKQWLLDNGIYKRTIYQLVRNENVTTETICKLCYLLKCKPQNIMEYMQPEETTAE